MKQIMALMVMMIFGGCRHMGSVSTVSLVKNGQSDHVIVQAAKPTEAEMFAATELADFIKRSTGAELKIVKEEEFKGIRAVYVGQTEFAKKHKIDFAKLGQEEWIIRAVDGNLIISGGRPRGTLYGAYEFLETFVGVRFPDLHTESVPENASLTIPADVAIQDKPAFIYRNILLGTTNPFFPKRTLFYARHKLNSHSYGAKLGGAFRYGRPYLTHTFEYYAEGLPENPEYWALNKDGKRIKGYDMCQSNPEVRKHFAAKLREFINLDREEIAKAGSGEQFPTVYLIWQTDGGDARCYCQNCKAIADTYGAYSGLQLEFINSIADDIAQDYPDIIIETGAYKYTEQPPMGIKPRDNVMIEMANLTTDMRADGQEKFRPIEDPANTRARTLIEGWGGISKQLAVHAYWTMCIRGAYWPKSQIGCLAPDLRFYWRHHARTFFTEANIPNFYNFIDLHFYLGAKLLQNPEQDEKKIIADFMRVQYGPSAPVMGRFLDYLEKRQRDDAGKLTLVPFPERKSFDREFFIETDRLLDEAERLAAGNPKHLANVRLERITVDEQLLWMWNQLENNGKLPFNREKILNRLRQNMAAVIEKYSVTWATPGTEERMDFLGNMPPTPPQFQGKTIVDICWPRMNSSSLGPRLKVDPDAAGGKALRLDATMKGNKTDEHDKLPTFGLYDGKNVERVVLERNKIPADEKYHFYAAGRTDGNKTQHQCLWAHHSWGLDPTLEPAYNVNNTNREFEVFVSLKFEGPAYVPASTRTNAFSMDRIILVEVDKTNQVITTGGAQ